MSQSMKLLNQMGIGSQPSASNVTEHSGTLYPYIAIVNV